jgi:hypothetical protein
MGSIKTMTDVRCFTRHHVWAVWDYMSLLKRLQRDLSCVKVPWVPSGAPGALTSLVTTIVQTEECDDTPWHGVKLSHYELYLQAMLALGVHSNAIRYATYATQSTGSFCRLSAIRAGAPHRAVDFARHNIDVATSGDLVEVAASFALGREDLIPDMFVQLLDGLPRGGDTYGAPRGDPSVLKFYFQRHVDLDGGVHGSLALDLLCRLCGEDPHNWDIAEEAALDALEHRRLLWDGVLEDINRHRLQMEPACP